MNHYKTLTALHTGNGWPPPAHPQFSVVGKPADYPPGEQKFTSDCYLIAFQVFTSGVRPYGRTPFSSGTGSLWFVKPRRVISMPKWGLTERGFMLLIHEAYLIGHDLHAIIKQCNFFHHEHEFNNALQLSFSQEVLMWELYNRIESEYLDYPDECSRDIILSHITSLLLYARRYSKQQADFRRRNLN